MHRNSIYKKLVFIAKPYSLVLLLAVLGVVVVKLIEAAAVKLVPNFADQTFFIKLQSSWFILLTIAVASIIWGVGRFISKYSIGYVTKSIAKDLRSKILSHMLVVPVTFFHKNAVGNIISKINYEVEQISRAISDSVLELLSGVVSIIFLVGVMFISSWKLTLIALVTTPLIACFFQIINIKIRKYSDRVQQSIGDISHLTHEIIEANQVIRIFEAMVNETKRINNLMLYNIKQELKIVFVSALSEASMRVILGAIIVVLAYVASRKGFNISSVDFGSFFIAIGALVRPIKQLSEVNHVIARGLAAANSVFELLELPVEKNNCATITTLSRDSIIKQPSFIMNLNRVDFAYPYEEQLVLKDINLTFETGKITAIIGRSGSGKSTLISLLPRFYHVNSGSITLNSVNINELDLQELRRQFAVVNQHIVLLSDTVANNIAYGGMSNASREEIIAAAKIANAMEFIEKLPNGLDTHIGHNGNLLSGGQRQRIAIARAVLKKAPILIFDEATSALDPFSEQQIQSALLALKPNIITIVIAHRMSTIENADQVAMLENGRLIAFGNHIELSQNPHYLKLHKAAINELL